MRKFVLLFATMIAVSASAQSVTELRNMQDTTEIETFRNMMLESFIAADSTVKSRRAEMAAAIEANNTAMIDADSLGVVAEENLMPVPNKPYEGKVVKSGGRDRYGKYTIQCAAHANGRLTKAGHYSQGHAYQIVSHFPSVINGYSNVSIPNLSKVSPEQRFATVLKMHLRAADYVKENLDISKLVPGKYYLVNMFYRTSPYMLQFFYAGRKQGTGNYGTHVGVLYYSTEHEAWIVEHNIHGDVYFDALVSILGGSNPHDYGVTSISRVTK